MAISEEQVRHVALLSRLALSDEQVHVLSEQLNTILEHIETIQELDLSEVPPTAHAVSVTNSMRPDEVVPGLTQEQALRNAPKQRDGAFVIPRIVGVEDEA